MLTVVSPMARTARYCLDCLLELTPENAASRDDRIILRAIGFTKGRYPNYEKHHRIETGACEKCGQDEVLIYYEIADYS
jgi:hypothetical protein